MPLTKERKQEIINDNGLKEGDTGSVEAQVSLLTGRITGLQEHFKQHKHDHHSRRGLLRMVERRKKLLSYLKRQSNERYSALIKKLNLRH